MINPTIITTGTRSIHLESPPLHHPVAFHPTAIPTDLLVIVMTQAKDLRVISYMNRRIKFHLLVTHLIVILLHYNRLMTRFNINKTLKTTYHLLFVFLPTVTPIPSHLVNSSMMIMEPR
jgi:hypothetical protein